jgi:dienelactone hydrolase
MVSTSPSGSLFTHGAPDPEHVPHRVLIARGELHDTDRSGRVVPYKLYFPVAHGLSHLPVVIWSHGLGGSADGAAYLARFLAGHGYVVVHPTHIGTDTSLWEGKPGHPWDIIRATPISEQVTRARVEDIAFLIDSLGSIAQVQTGMDGKVDTDRIGMSGHSFGAWTTQVIAGQKTTLGRSDARVRAAIAYSMMPSEEVEALGDPYDSIRIPLFCMTGTRDDTPMGGWGVERRVEVFDRSGAPETHLLVLEGGDHMVFAGSRGQLADYEAAHRHKEIIRIGALAFWEAYLKGDDTAHEWLTSGGFAEWMGPSGRYAVRQMIRDS